MGLREHVGELKLDHVADLKIDQLIEQLQKFKEEGLIKESINTISVYQYRNGASLFIDISALTTGSVDSMMKKSFIAASVPKMSAEAKKVAELKATIEKASKEVSELERSVK